MTKIRVKLLGQEHSAGRGVGFYRDNLAASLSRSGRVELVSAGEDLVHYPFFDLFYPTLSHPRGVIPTVVTIHDVTPLVFPKLYPLGIRARYALNQQKRALKNVSAILTDSLSSKKDLVSLLGLSPEKVFVTYLAADPIYAEKPTETAQKKVQEKYHLPERFILYVGGVNPNKNLLKLVHAAAKLNIPLVLVGSEFTRQPVKTFSIKKILGLQKVHPEVGEFIKLKSFIEGNTLFLTPGFVPTDDLATTYRLASVYCQPSLYEGFGLPVLEAMSAGCLLASSNAGSLPEIYPHGTITFDPENETEMEQAIASALTLSPKERKEKIKIASEKAKEFTREKTAAATIEVYETVLQFPNA